MSFTLHDSSFYPSSNFVKTVTIQKDDSILSISNPDAKPIVVIRPDGSIEIGPGLTVEGAARNAALVFWNCFGQNINEYIRNEKSPHLGANKNEK